MTAREHGLNKRELEAAQIQLRHGLGEGIAYYENETERRKMSFTGAQSNFKLTETTQF